MRYANKGSLLTRFKHVDGWVRLSNNYLIINSSNLRKTAYNRYTAWSLLRSSSSRFCDVSRAQRLSDYARMVLLDDFSYIRYRLRPSFSIDRIRIRIRRGGGMHFWSISYTRSFEANWQYVCGREVRYALLLHIYIYQTRLVVDWSWKAGMSILFLLRNFISISSLYRYTVKKNEEIF